MSLTPDPEAKPDAPGLLTRLGQWAVLALGWLMIVVGLVFAFLPGHLGVPVLALGLVLLLRNSYAARRRFIRFQRKHPKLIYPLRRLLRRNPEVLAVAWQQALRMERLLLPWKWRRAARWRRAVRRRIRQRRSGV